MKKLTILGLHMGYGGIENCIASLANNLCDQYDVTIVSIYKLYSKPVYEIDNRVKIEYLIEGNLAIRVDRYKKLLKSGKLTQLINVLWNDYIKKGFIIKLFKDTFSSMKIVKQKKIKMIDYLKHMKTDIVISTRVELNNLVSEYVDDKTKKIAWEHNHGDAKYIENVVKSCSKMHKVILVSNNLYELYKEEIEKQGLNLKCAYIPNIIDVLPNSVSKLCTKNIISVGRLASEKGYLDLIDVFKKIYKKDKKVRLTIIGDGDQKKDIIEKIKREKLEKVIYLPGFKEKDYINNALLNSSVYLMTSYTESFGIVLVEANAAGVPCIAFTSAEGANEIIADKVNGYLVENRDQDKMAELTLELLNDKVKLKKMGKKARENSLKYTKDVVYKIWKDEL